ncbi:MAG: hypothetical protein B7733_12680 [Myxococcales bacterium FL481]|nr:MAG: hypothetical protein B7733_12680 [Myxococcales bacterium FL481]
MVEGLARASEAIGDAETVAAYAREAQSVATEHLARPQAALPALRRASTLAQHDDELAQTLGDGLAAAGELDEAHTVFLDLIARFGRRRSPERARAHVSLSRVLQQLGRVDDAITELETAVQIDASRGSTLARLGRIAVLAERWDTAERAYRMLLLALGRRGHAEAVGDDEGLASSRAEVLVELSAIARFRGHDDQAQELAESALDAAMDEGGGSSRLRAMLWDRDEKHLLARLLEAEAAAATQASQRAERWAELAKLQQARGDAPGDVLAVWLRVVQEQPASPDYHAAARASAESADEIERYGDALAALLDSPETASDPYARCEVLLRRGELFEQALAQPERAAEYYALAEHTQVRVIDVWRAQARLAGLIGDRERQAEVLERLANVGEEEEGTRSAALYTLAEVHFARPETASRGVAALERALEEGHNETRALDILAAASDGLGATGAVDWGLLGLYERIARASGHEDRLLHCLRAMALHPDAEPEQVEKAYRLAVKLSRDHDINALLERAVQCSRDAPDGLRRGSWAFLESAQRCLDRGDAAAAGELYLAVFDVLAVADRSTVYAFARRLADAERTDHADLLVVRRIYERGLEVEATSREIWEPLARIYERVGDLEALRLLHDDIVDGLPSRDDRNTLRCVLARALVHRGEDLDEASQRLNEALEEDPDHGSAQELLAECMARTGDTDKLVSLLREQLSVAYAADELERAAAVALRLGALLEADDIEQALELYRDAARRGAVGRKLLLALRRVLEGRDDGPELTRVYERLADYEEDPNERAVLAVLAGRRHVASGDFAAARRVLEDVYDPREPQAEIEAQLEKTFVAMNDAAALAELMMSTARGPEALARLRRAAACFLEVGDRPSALGALERAREEAPDDLDTLVSWCDVMRAMDRGSEVLAELTASLAGQVDESPAQGRLLRLRGECLEEAGNLAAALVDYERAFRLTPDPTLAERLYRVVSGRMAEVEREEPPDLAALRELTLMLAQIHASQGELAQERAVLAAWVERDRKDTDVLGRVVELAVRDEDWEAAIASSNQLVAVTSGSTQVEAARWLDRCTRAHGDPELARRGLEHVRRKQPDSVEARELLIAHYEVTGADVRLAKLLVSEAETAPDDEQRAELLGRAGELAVAGQDTELALDLLGRAVALRPEQTSWVLALVDAHVRCGDVVQGASVIEVAISATRRRGADLAQLQRKRATLADMLGDREAQLEWLENALTSDRHNLDVAMELAAAAETACAWELASRALRTVTLSDEASSSLRAESFARQGRIALLVGDRKRARFYAHKARHEDADVPVVMELDRLIEEDG